ncbi:MAG: DUF2480 family protein [Bacteroidia bacterium]
MEELIENKVEKSGLITISLDEFYVEGERILIDLKDLLYEGLILREKDIREFVKNENWEKYQNKFVAIYCSTDAIIPMWSYMLIASALEPYAKKIVFGDLKELEAHLFIHEIEKLEIEKYKNERVIIKGCGKIPTPEAAFVAITTKLRPVVKSLMFGEACSTVPIYKSR